MPLFFNKCSTIHLSEKLFNLIHCFLSLGKILVSQEAQSVIVSDYELDGRCLIPDKGRGFFL
jgi:hypothetical protein